MRYHGSRAIQQFSVLRYTVQCVHIHLCDKGELPNTPRLSLVYEILKIASRRVSNDKSEIWFENLTCLWTNANHPKVLQIRRGLPYGHKDDNFIAVSYSSEYTPGLECRRHGGYTIMSGSGTYVRQSKVRDDIL